MPVRRRRRAERFHADDGLSSLLDNGPNGFVPAFEGARDPTLSVIVYPWFSHKNTQIFDQVT